MALSRRSMLRTLGTGLATASVSSLVWTGRARASDLALSDRIDLLYSNQFHFNDRGEPQITVGLMTGQRRVELSAPHGFDILPSGDGGTRIKAGKRLSVELGKATPAKQTYTLVLEELTGKNAVRPDPAMKRWDARGFSAHDDEVGTVFGVEGRVLDNRRVLVTSGRFSSERVALEHAHQAKVEHGAVGKLHPIVHHRGEGRMVAKDLDHDIEIAAEGVLWFAPRGGGPVTVHDVLHGTTMGKGSRADRQYAGNVYVAIDQHGKLSVVNLVSESDLLAGLVPAEIFASAPMESLKAQAVAARGQLVTKVGTRHIADPFLVCAEQHCQVYKGHGHEHPRTTKAVDQTLGVVAMRPSETQLVDTVYSANSGGHTEHNDVVWPGAADPQLRGRPDPKLGKAFAEGITEANIATFLSSPPQTYSRPPKESAQTPYRWTVTVDPASVAGNRGVPKDLGHVKAMRVADRGRSGRATTLELVGTKRTVTIRGELRIRRALGSLKSSMFIIEPARDKFGRFVLHGGGHGHGVGLCQHGAMGMARSGKSYADILAHYYADCSVVKLW
ncbi:MAG: SpoIID/LytB domain-containing protein [Myxococcota bacterium]